MLEEMKRGGSLAYKNFITFIIWVIFGSVIGVVVGIVGVLFHFGIEYATEYRIDNPMILWLLPFGGLFIVLIYRLQGIEKDRGTNFILVAVRSNEKVSVKMAPLIFISAIITHLFGGSSGREGAALQLGGSISAKIGRLVKLDEKDERVITMCGMSAAFAALFGTPITSVLFAMEVITVGVMHYSAIVPCVVAALIGAGIATCFGISPTAFTLTGVPMGMSVSTAGSVMLLAICCAVLSIFFCSFMKMISAAYKKYIPNTYVRVFVGGSIVIALTYLVGIRDYNGAGMDVVSRALEGEARPEAFFLKIIFTAFTLGAGFKGGEIVPAFFVGATFGSVMGPIVGLHSSFAAGIGLATIFCGVTNCPLTSLVLCVELFGIKGLGYYALACAVSYMLSGYCGLYSEQKIMYSKFKPEFINKNAE